MYSRIIITVTAAALALSACAGGVCYEEQGEVLCEDSFGQVQQPIDTSKLKSQHSGEGLLDQAKKHKRMTSKKKKKYVPGKGPRGSYTPATATCGDGACLGNEKWYTCPKDCLPLCGNGVIDPGETCEGSQVSCKEYGFDSGIIGCALCNLSGGLFQSDPFINCENQTNDGKLACTFTRQKAFTNHNGTILEKYSCTCCDAATGGDCKNGHHFGHAILTNICTFD